MYMAVESLCRGYCGDGVKPSQGVGIPWLDVSNLWDAAFLIHVRAGAHIEPYFGVPNTERLS